MCCYSRPRTLKDILSIEEKKILLLDSRVTEEGISEGSPYMNTYELRMLTPDTENYQAMIDILKGCQYRSSYQNLIPWSNISIGSESPKSDVTVNLVFVYGNEPTDYCSLGFFSNGCCIASNANGSSQIFHLTDMKTIDRLASYIKTYGIAK